MTTPTHRFRFAGPQQPGALREHRHLLVSPRAVEAVWAQEQGAS
jgi:hypothetical protein